MDALQELLNEIERVQCRAVLARVPPERPVRTRDLMEELRLTPTACARMVGRMTRDSRVRTSTDGTHHLPQEQDPITPGAPSVPRRARPAVPSLDHDPSRRVRPQVRKRILDRAIPDPPSDAGWLDLDQVAEIELTSEDPSHPIELALRPGAGAGWRAGEAGPQTIRLRFDPPQRLRRVRLAFEEREEERTQEFVLRWSSARDASYRDVVRQQYNFSPPATTLEVEDYSVELDGVRSLELEIVPDVRGGESRASLREWRLA